MKPASLGIPLLLSTLLVACGDASTPGEQGADASAGLPAPFEILAAVPHENRPYGLDVYTAHCLSCHGELGLGGNGNPTLKGLNRTALHQRLLDYRGGKVTGDTAAAMTQAVAALSDAEIAAVAIYAGE
ncbi:MAG: c-type cytochrome [Pseudomonadota bacterium]